MKSNGKQYGHCIWRGMPATEEETLPEARLKSRFTKVFLYGLHCQHITSFGVAQDGPTLLCRLYRLYRLLTWSRLREEIPRDCSDFSDCSGFTTRQARKEARRSYLKLVQHQAAAASPPHRLTASSERFTEPSFSEPRDRGEQGHQRLQRLQRLLPLQLSV